MIIINVNNTKTFTAPSLSQSSDGMPSTFADIRHQMHSLVPRPYHFWFFLIARILWYRSDEIVRLLNACSKNHSQCRIQGVFSARCDLDKRLEGNSVGNLVKVDRKLTFSFCVIIDWRCLKTLHVKFIYVPKLNSCSSIFCPVCPSLCMSFRLWQKLLPWS